NFASLGDAVVNYTSIVQLKNGQIRGSVIDAGDGLQVEFYEAIKFGKADRFKKPSPVNSWTGVYNATSAGKNCIQFRIPSNDSTASEDCLFLNVWKKSGFSGSSHLLPVMVWIYGGAFVVGGIFGDYDARYIASLGDVIVVTFNYRLGPLGFLTDGQSDSVPPNLGLHDQVLALKWVQENIAGFNGDPQLVTIFGESAGAQSVGALVVSPLAKGLFKRAIAQSGSPSVNFTVITKEQAVERTKVYGKKLNCTSIQLEEVVKCISRKSVAQLQAATLTDMPTYELFFPVYGADELLPLHPSAALLQNGSSSTGFHQIDYMYGFTRDEGSFFLLQKFPELALATTRLTVNSTRQYITQMMASDGRSERVGEEVAHFYHRHLLPPSPTQEQLRSMLVSVWSDSLMVCPSMLFGEQLARAHSRSASALGKVFAYRLMQSGPVGAALPAWIGVPHGADLYYLFQYGKTRSVQADNDLARYMIKSWTSFARTGQPNSGNWLEAVNRRDGDFFTKYMHLEMNHFKMVQNEYFRSVCQFWRKYIFD
ncbi:PREDICTED: cholinesterase 1-like, partial [Rhagoletis zephyria]|uniref:cholinesterase 1-like n=1 Tax=Rhagoletis zephyria TaxID=28612 RepID=UPI0008117671